MCNTIVREPTMFAKLMSASAIAAAGLLGPAAAQAADVGVSIRISEPGVHGRIDIGRFPQPRVVVQQPVIVVPPPRVVARPEPVYMWVPPGHRRHWRQHCREYGACGVPVYFVRDDWYDREVRHGKGRGRGHDHDRGHGRNKHRGRDDD
jgi:hypothetical protein